MKTAEYLMMATYLSKVQCEKIMRPFLNASLSASGVVRSMPRAIVWGPMRYQGLGIRHLWTTQGVEHLLAILRHATRSTLTGQLIRTSMEDMQLEIGVSASFLKSSYNYYGCLATRSWISETWRFLSDSRITVVDPFPKPPLACPNDCFLMERFFQHGYRGSDLLQLNQCRMHLHALRLSDLCTANGAHLTNLTLDVVPDPCRSLPFSWPRTHRPSSKSRFLWRSAISTVFTRPTDAQVLIQPLLPYSPLSPPPGFGNSRHPNSVSSFRMSPLGIFTTSRQAGGSPGTDYTDTAD
jgi:hypothetical protein